MTTIEIILSFITAILGAGNLAQWSNLRAVRAKARYEAEDAHIEGLKKIIELQADEIKRLQERQKELEDRINQLEEETRQK